jgi:hypothetical protein
MNALRWIFGLPLAITLAFIFDWCWKSLFESILYNYAIQHPQINRINNVAEGAVTNALLIFLSCWFVPSSKKYVAMGWVVFVLAHSIYYYFANPDSYNSGITYMVDSFFMVLGLFIGFYISYLRFKREGWGSSAKGNISNEAN